jgi:hypothetical protein
MAFVAAVCAVVTLVLVVVSELFNEVIDELLDVTRPSIAVTLLSSVVSAADDALVASPVVA